MKDTQETLSSGFAPVESCRIPHVICMADFNTNYPNPNRINRIAGEISEYLKCQKNHMTDGV